MQIREPSFEQFHVLSFEGPDPYSRAGGIASRRDGVDRRDRGRRSRDASLVYAASLPPFMLQKADASKESARMTSPMPTIRSFMTTCPQTVGAGQTVASAHTLLYEHRVRQLPVIEEGHLVGLLSDRDLTLIASLRDVDLHAVKVEEIMSLSLYKVSPDAPLEQVAREMAAKKYGAAVVIENDGVVGIFTTVDACTALASVLSQAHAT